MSFSEVRSTVKVATRAFEVVSLVTYTWYPLNFNQYFGRRKYMHRSYSYYKGSKDGSFDYDTNHPKGVANVGNFKMSTNNIQSDLMNSLVALHFLSSSVPLDLAHCDDSNTILIRPPPPIQTFNQNVETLF